MAKKTCTLAALRLMLPRLKAGGHWATIQTTTLLAAFACCAPAYAQVTSLTLISQPGDYVGAGQFQFYTPADGTFAAVRNFAQGVSVSFSGAEHWWYLDFAAPNNAPLTVGTYSGAARYPFQSPSQPGLSVDGDGRGCNTLTGSFQVLQVTYGSSNEVTSFDATFEQHCEGMAPALTGEIRYNANLTVSITAPSHLTVVDNHDLTFTVTATDAQGGHLVLTATGMPLGASFVDNGNQTGTFSWRPTSAQDGTYIVRFQADSSLGGTNSTYTQIVVIPPPAPNDDFSQPTVIPYIPFMVTEDVTNATTAPDDPFSYGAIKTVWFAFAPSAAMRVEANTFGSNYDTTLSVYTGARGSLIQVGANEDAAGTQQSRVRFEATAGTTYYFMVGARWTLGSPNILVFNVVPAPPPLTIAPSISQFGSVNPTTGAAIVYGTVACSAPAYVSISGQIKQMHGGTAISGYFGAFVPCEGTTAWKAEITPQLALFHGRSVALFTGGKANIAGTGWAFDPDTGEYVTRNFSIEITLRGAK